MGKYVMQTVLFLNPRTTPRYGNFKCRVLCADFIGQCISPALKQVVRNLLTMLGPSSNDNTQQTIIYEGAEDENIQA